MKTKQWDILFQTTVVLIFTGFVILCIYPFYYIFIYSLSDPGVVVKANIFFVPAGFTFSNYIQILKLPGIFSAFAVSICRVVIGTVVTVFVNSMLAYTLTKHQLPGKKILYRISVVSMYINAGLIPWYVVMVKLGLKNNPLLYVLPYAVVAFYLILIKTYIEQLPVALEESAFIDGAGFFTIFIKIIMPLCKPILAAVAVFSAVNQWNMWYDNLFLVNAKNLQTLQLTLLNYLKEAEAIAQRAIAGNSLQGVQNYLSPLSIKMTLTMVVAIPIILVYPIMQKYFVKGIMIGAIKG
jgi:ABC-type sugar transport system, permease component